VLRDELVSEYQALAHHQPVRPAQMIVLSDDGPLLGAPKWVAAMRHSVSPGRMTYCIALSQAVKRPHSRGTRVPAILPTSSSFDTSHRTQGSIGFVLFHQSEGTPFRKQPPGSRAAAAQVPLGFKPGHVVALYRTR
jgi:hypothetical protein